MTEDGALRRAEEAELAARRETLGQAADRVTSALAEALSATSPSSRRRMPSESVS